MRAMAERMVRGGSRVRDVVVTARRLATDDSMAFLRPSLSVDPEAEIRGARVYLRHPAMQDYAAWAELGR